MFWLRNKKNNFPVRTLIWRPVTLVVDCGNCQSVSRIFNGSGFKQLQSTLADSEGPDEMLHKLMRHQGLPWLQLKIETFSETEVHLYLEIS